MLSGALSKLFQRISTDRSSLPQRSEKQNYSPQVYQAVPQYQSFAELFNQPQFDYSQVGDVYERGAMPNNLLNRYNSLMQNLQAQQAAMVPRSPAPTSSAPSTGGQLPPMTRVNPYVNFSQLFGGR